MALPRSFACICYDSSIILAESLQNQDAKTRLGKIKEYQKILKLDVFIPPTVKNECSDRITDIIGFIAALIREFEGYFRKRKSVDIRSKNISFDDTKYVREFFIEKQKPLKKFESESEILRRIEALIVSYMWERVKMYDTISYYDLMTGMMVEIVGYSNLVRDNFKNILKNSLSITDNIDQKLLQLLSNNPKLIKTAKKKPHDLQIICEVAAHQKSSKKWSILVTLDASDMLNNAEEIDNLTNVKCVDPLYLPELVHSLRSQKVT